MLNQHTLQLLTELKLDSPRLPRGMAHAFEEQSGQTSIASLSFEERFGLLVDREFTHRDTKRVDRLLKQAKLKVAGACIEDIDYRAGRSLDKRLMASLSTCDWIRHGHSLLITGATGCGKTWLACAFGQQACRQGFSALYVRVPRLFEELRIAHGDGSFTRKLAALARTDMLLLDDWGVNPLTQPERSDLLEILDDRVATRSTMALGHPVITSQLPVEHWHEYLADPTLADAILDRIVHQRHKLKLKGESLRKKETT